YEAVLDGAPAGPDLERVAADGATVLQASVPGAGGSRSLAWIHAGGSPSADEYVRVQSNGCPASCDSNDVYRLRFYETTGYIPRFNNSATQVSVLVLQNQGDTPLSLDVRFWGQDGAPLAGQLLALAPRQATVLDTSSLVPGQGGSVSVAHSGRHGQL